MFQRAYLIHLSLFTLFIIMQKLSSFVIIIMLSRPNQDHLHDQNSNGSDIQLSCDQLKNMHEAIAMARVAYHCGEDPVTGGLSFSLFPLAESQVG